MVEVITITNYREGYALGGSVKMDGIGIGINLFKGQPDTIHRVELIGADINFHGCLTVLVFEVSLWRSSPSIKVILMKSCHASRDFDKKVSYKTMFQCDTLLQ
jgi:hypothetical protein